MILCFLLPLLLPLVSAYLEQTFDIAVSPVELGISDACTLYSTENVTYLHFHGGGIIHKNITSPIFAVNNQCDLVVFGYPDNNEVKLWRPLEDTITSIRKPYQPEAIVNRFGFSVDVQNQSWVVGAPGLPNSATGKGAEIGYAFVYDGDNLHSCRSLYDTYCYPFGTECKLANFKNTKDYYKFMKTDPLYTGVFNNSDIQVQIKDYEMPGFQKICIHPQQPYYATGPIDPVLVPNFEYQQFGYAVALSGQLGHWGTSLYISAPGDTNRFMEDNAGANYGRVYMWDTQIWDPQDESIDNITWWDYSVFSPLIPPDLGTATYRAFGRDIAVGRSALAVSTYPLYDNTREPFIIVYDCKPELTTASHCEESPERGISIDDLPGNALGYLTNKMLAYTDGKTRWNYIPSNIDNDGLDDFQNEFIGKHIGVTGSNVIVPDHYNKKAYRFGKDSEKRETHNYLQNTNFGTNTHHWILQNHKKLTHMWPCPAGSTSGKEYCNWGQDVCISRRCVPCELQYYSADGWLQYCDPCIRNFTTYQEGMTYCDPFVIPIIPGLTWDETFYIMCVLGGGALAAYLFVILWQYVCISKRKPRTFKDKILV
jgi:hypothetical protein